MAIILPTVEGADGTFSTTIEGKRFTFNTKWNSRSGTWHLTVSTSDGIALITGQKILPRLELILNNEELFVDGNVYAYNNIENDSELITRDNFGIGKTYQLLYVSAEEAEDTLQAWQL